MDRGDAERQMLYKIFTATVSLQELFHGLSAFNENIFNIQKKSKIFPDNNLYLFLGFSINLLSGRNVSRAFLCPRTKEINEFSDKLIISMDEYHLKLKKALQNDFITDTLKSINKFFSHIASAQIILEILSAAHFQKAANETMTDHLKKIEKIFLTECAGLGLRETIPLEIRQNLSIAPLYVVINTFLKREMYLNVLHLPFKEIKTEGQCLFNAEDAAFFRQNLPNLFK